MVFVLAAAVSVSAASASPKKHSAAQSSHLLVGINDEPDTLYGDPATAFAALHELNVQVLRVNLYWGGNKWAVANSKPSDPTDPGDPAYNWSLYDRLVATRTPTTSRSCSRSSSRRRGRTAARAKTVAPTNYTDLTNFAYAAAERYSGLWTPPPWQRDPQLGIDGTAAAEGEPLDGVERAEQPDLAHAAVQEGRQEVGDLERPYVREDLQRDLQRRALAVPRPAARRAGRLRRHRPEGQRRAVDGARRRSTRCRS